MRRVKSQARGKRQEARGNSRSGWLSSLALNPQLSTLNPSGATLSEILISLLVMSVGVVSLATLFPISVLRSIQATQLTNATILRYNVEQLVETFPRLVHNPIAGGTIPEAQSGNYVVDPLGWNNPVLAGTPFGNMTRYPGALNNGFALNTTNRAMQYAYLPDSWQVAAKGVAPTLNPNNSITVAGGVDTQTAQNTLGILGVGSVRVILFSANGKSSVARSVTSIAGSTVSWDDGSAVITSDNLPTTGYSSIQRYRLEFTDPRYSWLLTVRKTPNPLFTFGDANVDVVVFHKREFSAASEQIYNLDANVATGATSMTLRLSSPTNRPFLKRGGFIFDVQNAHWYRIVQFTEDPLNPVITIDQPARSGMTSSLPAVMAMRGVVEVFPLGTISYDPNNPP